MILHNYNLVIINTSGGKDSLCSIFNIYNLADKQKYPHEQIVLSHQDLGEMEWKGTKELVKEHGKLFGFKVYYSKRRTKDFIEETLLEYIKRRGKFPSNKQRYCTSDMKRGPGGRVVTMLTKNTECRILYIFGFRKEESPFRSKLEPIKQNIILSTKKRWVEDYLPIHEWKLDDVWNTIKTNSLPYHYAYDLGMPRLSCCFCIFSPFDALVLSGYHNKELLEAYVKVEKEIGHTFRHNFKIESVLNAVNNGYKPKIIEDWKM